MYEIISYTTVPLCMHTRKDKKPTITTPKPPTLPLLSLPQYLVKQGIENKDFLCSVNSIFKIQYLLAWR